jgi:hypothetical protein
MKNEDQDPRVDVECCAPTTGSTAQSTNGCVQTLQEIQRRDGVGVAEAMRRQEAAFDLAHGLRRTIEACWNCRGTGSQPDMSCCPICGGGGKVLR